MRSRFFRGVGEEMPRRRTLAAAIAYATAREGVSSIVALVNGSGAPIATIWNRVTVASPQVERIGPVDVAAASDGTLAIGTDIIAADGTPSIAWSAGAGLATTGAVAFPTMPLRGDALPTMHARHSLTAAATGGEHVLCGYALASDTSKSAMSGVLHTGTGWAEVISNNWAAPSAAYGDTTDPTDEWIEWLRYALTDDGTRYLGGVVEKGVAIFRTIGTQTDLVRDVDAVVCLWSSVETTWSEIY